jgi:tetratricopeptide (TPR) repeat protein
VIRLVFLALLCAAVPAHADRFWGHGAPSHGLTPRDRALQEGNYHLAEARRRAQYAAAPLAVPPQVLEHARAAVRAYETALAISEDADTHLRALTAARYIDGPHGICGACRDGFEAVVRHIDGIRRVDPMNARELDLATEAALALSKLGALGGPDADADFERAIAEYEHWHRLADEANSDLARPVALAYANEAELQMAAGHLAEAIAEYNASVDLDPTEALAYYGLAVAYDRDGQWSKAVAAMQAALVRDRMVTRLEQEGVFFVPDGDLYYYYALAHQVLAQYVLPPERRAESLALAATEYNRFLTHARGTRYATRAHEHLDELAKPQPAHP